MVGQREQGRTRAVECGGQCFEEYVGPRLDRRELAWFQGCPCNGLVIWVAAVM
jgi:hypothetical protein